MAMRLSCACPISDSLDNGASRLTTIAKPGPSLLIFQVWRVPLVMCGCSTLSPALTGTHHCHSVYEPSRALIRVEGLSQLHIGIRHTVQLPGGWLGAQTANMLLHYVW